MDMLIQCVVVSSGGLYDNTWGKHPRWTELLFFTLCEIQKVVQA